MNIMIDAVVHTVSFVNFQKIEYNWTNGSIYDFFVEKSVFYEVQQRSVCTFSNLMRMNEKFIAVKFHI